MSERKDEERIVELAKEIAIKALDEVMVRTKKTDIAYACFQNNFDCDKYSCKEPDECHQNFGCNSNYTASC